ncbi:MAG TPA: D-tyrosyl-tRNA(Tyr) deacylase [Clostridia bacterium]|nr:D-tyrosyl-tRNA(Tyr) deacylase [Clostridia bacterium]
MRVVVQRVKTSAVSVKGTTVGQIDKGLLVFLGVGAGDTKNDVDYLVRKIINLRVFEDQNGKLNYSLQDIKGEMLVVSQFTLYGDCRKGRRPSFSGAASLEKADALYQEFVQQVKSAGIKVATGVFQAEMLVKIENEGPLTLLLDSNKNF